MAKKTIEYYYDSEKVCPYCDADLSKYIAEDDAWECGNCGKIIPDKEAYDAPSFNEEDIPEACVTCGGPYPDCMDSCKLYD